MYIYSSFSYVTLFQELLAGNSAHNGLWDCNKSKERKSSIPQTHNSETSKRKHCHDDRKDCMLLSAIHAATPVVTKKRKEERRSRQRSCCKMPQSHPQVQLLEKCRLLGPKTELLHFQPKDDQVVKVPSHIFYQSGKN